MNTIVVTSNTYVPFLARALEYTPTVLVQCIVCADADTHLPVAGVLYDCYNGQIVHCHIWMDAERRPSREWFAAIFDYPFNQMQVGKIIGQVRSSNKEAQKLDKHFGFELEATISEYFDDGSDLLVYTLTREQCRVLNSESWQRVVKSLRRA